GMEAFDQIVSIIGADGKTYVFNSASEASIFLSSLKVGDVITVNAYRYTPKSSVMGTSFERTELSFTVTVTEYKGA
ncbi:MAG: hypothetical protein IJY04_04365, partial [Clostridia bacterium]|nr:hypothetical protein [Clostridia bacterium]